MMYLAIGTNASGIDRDELMARSHKWWNEGERPEGFRTVAAYRTLGSGGPDVYIFETESHDDIKKVVSFWRGIVEFEFHPAFDALEEWREQGMNVA